MELTELSQDQFTAFFETHPQSTFLQSPCWGDLKHKNGWDVTYLGFVSKNQVIAGCMLLSKTTPILLPEDSVRLISPLKKLSSEYPSK